MPALRRANELARETMFPGTKRQAWTEVTVSKVLHRLARNVPLVDSRVKRFYATSYAGDLRKLLHADLVRNRAWLEDLTPAYPIRGEPMPLTRASDILIWMDGRPDHPASQFSPLLIIRTRSPAPPGGRARWRSTQGICRRRARRSPIPSRPVLSLSRKRDTERHGRSKRGCL